MWDPTAETPFIVVPPRPAGTDGWNEERLALLVVWRIDSRVRLVPRSIAS